MNSEFLMAIPQQIYPSKDEFEVILPVHFEDENRHSYVKNMNIKIIYTEGNDRNQQQSISIEITDEQIIDSLFHAIVTPQDYL